MHDDDFLPFLVDEEGNLLTQEGFDEYCNRVNWTSAQGGAWGGEPEVYYFKFINKILEF